MILIDTNIFLELLLGRKRASECGQLLDRIARGEREAVVTHFTVHAVEAVLRSGPPLTMFLRNLEHSLGLTLYDTDLSDEMAAGLLAEKLKRDFDDTLQYYAAKKLGAEAIVSFDEHFDGLDVPRLVPAALTKGLG